MHLKEQETSKFSISIKTIDKPNENLADENFEISKAHLEKFTELYPDIPDVSKKRLISFASETAVINLVNENDDVLLTEDAIKLAPTFIYKPVNYEHSSYEILGFITNYGFSKFSDSSPVDESQIDLGSKEPFYMNFGGVLWNNLYSITKDLECSDFMQDIYSTSWEVRFNKFYVAIGSKKIADAEIITDEYEIERLKPHLRRYGGKGFLPDGRPIYRVLTGDLYGDGIAITSNPAADVNGVSIKADKKESYSVDEIVFASNASTEEDKEENLNKKQKNSSTIKKEIVYKKSMKNFEALIKTDEGGEVSFANVTELRKAFEEAVQESASEYVRKAEEQSLAKKQMEEELSKAQQASKDLEDKFLKLSSQLDEFQKAQAHRESEEAFKERFQKVSSSFELKQEVLPIVEKRVRLCQDDASFASLLSEFEVMLPKKTDASTKADSTEENVFDKSTASAGQVTIPNASDSDSTPKQIKVSQKESEKGIQLFI